MSAGIGCDFKGELIDPFVISTQIIPNHTQVQRPLGDGSWRQGVAAFEQAEFKQTDDMSMLLTNTKNAPTCTIS
jgi:hypothetical protein